MRAVVTTMLSVLVVVTAETSDAVGGDSVAAVTAACDVVDPATDPVVVSLAQPATITARVPTATTNRCESRGFTGYRGRPSTRSPRMLRITLDVPPMIV